MCAHVSGTGCEIEYGCAAPRVVGMRLGVYHAGPCEGHVKVHVKVHVKGACKSCRYIRVGSIVMVLHDPSDIFLEAAKLLNYVGAETASVSCFAGLILSWLVLRLTLLPFWVIRSTG
jgi:TLC domain